MPLSPPTEERVIILGLLTDLTGAAAYTGKWLKRSVEVWVDYVNTYDPIPGVKLEVISFDHRYEVGKAILGYRWLKEKGAIAMLDFSTSNAEALKPICAEAHIPFYETGSTDVLLKPPGWVFCYTPDIGIMLRHSSSGLPLNGSMRLKEDALKLVLWGGITPWD